MKGYSMRSRILSFAFALSSLLGFGTAAEAKLAELLVTDAGQLKTVDLKEVEVTSQIDLTAARVTYDMTFRSQFDATEGTFYFALPTGAYPHEFGMWVDDHYQRSAIVEAQAGRVAYESMVRRGVDPALLEWTAGNTFKMRVYPLRQGKPMRVKLVVGMPLRGVGGKLLATVPLDFGKLNEFKFAVKGRILADDLPKVKGLKSLELSEDGDKSGVLSFSGSFRKDSYLPPSEVTLVVNETDPTTVKVRREDTDERYFEAHAFPKLPSEKRTEAEHAVVYWDYSLSEQDHHAARLDALRKFLKVRSPKTVDVYGFQQHVFPVKMAVKASDWAAVQAAVATRAYDGATRIDHLLTSLREVLPKFKKTTDVALFTNGVDSFELFDWKKQKSLASDLLNTYVIAPKTGSNTATLGRLAKEIGAVVLDQDDELSAAMFDVRPWAVTGVSVSKALQKIESPIGDALYPGDAIVVRGQVKKDGPASFTVTVAQNGKEKKLSYKFDTDDVPVEKSETVPRLWAKERIDRLLPEKRTHTPEITALALQHQLMSPFTVMVVLETCENYAEFKIKAPSDCLKRRESFAIGDMFGNEGGVEEESNMAMSDEAAEDGVAGEAAAGPTAEPGDSFDFERGDSHGQSMSEAPAAPERSMAASARDSNMDEESAEESEIADSGDYIDDENMGGKFEDTKPRPFGFEDLLTAKVAAGADALYATYLKVREPYVKIPYYYIFAADLFARLKRTDLADLVLSNLVEIRPGEARWLRVYAYNLIAWGKAADTVAIYRSVSELRGEDPQSFRDFGLAQEAVGQPVAAMKLFEKVKIGKWDSRLEGMNRTVLHDLVRASEKVLKMPNLTAENRAQAQKYANATTAQKDKITVTVSWDTDNTDIDLHVIEPTGTHVWYANKEPKNTAGKLNWDSTQGFGPEQYRNASPLRGAYRVFLHYYAQDRAALADGTFARIDFKVVQNGVEQTYTKTAFLRDREQNLTISTFDYEDANAKLPPPDFRSTMARAKAVMERGQDAAAISVINSLGKRQDPKEEAQRHFHIGRAQIHLKQYAEAERSNQRALALDPSLLAAHFNNACAASLAKDTKKAAHHLNLLADALLRAPQRRTAYLRLMKNDPDLAFVRSSKGFSAAEKRLRTGH